MRTMEGTVRTPAEIDDGGVHLPKDFPKRKALNGQPLEDGQYDRGERYNNHFQEGDKYVGGVLTREGAAQLNMNRDKERQGLKQPIEVILQSGGRFTVKPRRLKSENP